MIPKKVTINYKTYIRESKKKWCDIEVVVLMCDRQCKENIEQDRHNTNNKKDGERQKEERGK